MDAKSIFFTIVFGGLGGYCVWAGLRALRRPSRAGAARAMGTLVLGVLILLALFVMVGPHPF